MRRWRRIARLAPAVVLAGGVVVSAGMVAVPVASSEPGSLEPRSTNVNMVGEAFTVRADATVPTDLLLARYPRAATEVSDDLSTGFAAFADPGFLGRFGIGAGFAASGRRELTAPTWSECLYPESPKTPTAETRSPGLGLGPTAVAECRARGSHLAGYATQAAPDGAEAGHLRGGPLTATVDTNATDDGVTDVVSASDIDDVTIGGVVTVRSIRNRAVATTTGRAGGAKATAEATIGALLVNGQPVALPSNSIAQLGPVLAALGPVVAPAGTLTFDVVPELIEQAADGSAATARAAQLTVSFHTAQLTVTYGLGYARAGARTIVNTPAASVPGLGDGLGSLPPAPAQSEPAPPAESAAAAGSEAFGSAPDGGAAGAATDVAAGPSFPPPAFGSAPVPGPGSGAAAPSPGPPAGATASGAPAAGPSGPAAPFLSAAAPAQAVATGPAGPSKGTVALIGVLCALALVRYLSYSTKLRRSQEAVR
ncbi:MAG TPA: hypothetical protein VHL53_07595 [Acidimicrobiia bacterium]|nr:hypothetical protein [Acidimicrobiia bacterium]